MKRLLTCAALSLAGLALATAPASAWWNSCSCCGCDVKLVCSQYNAFSPCCCHGLSINGCCYVPFNCGPKCEPEVGWPDGHLAYGGQGQPAKESPAAAGDGKGQASPQGTPTFTAPPPKPLPAGQPMNPGPATGQMPPQNWGNNQYAARPYWYPPALPYAPAYNQQQAYAPRPPAPYPPGMPAYGPQGYAPTMPVYGQQMPMPYGYAPQQPYGYPPQAYSYARPPQAYGYAPMPNYGTGGAGYGMPGM